MNAGLKPTTSSSSLIRARRSRLGADPVHDERLADDVADRHAGVERGVRILEDDLHLPPHPAHLLATDLGQLDTLEAHRARGRLEELEDAVAGRRLARAGLADEPERLARSDVEADAVDRLHVADLALDQDPLPDREVLVEVLDLRAARRSCSCRRRLRRARTGSLAGGMGRAHPVALPNLAQLGQPLGARVAAGVGTPRREAARLRRVDQIGRAARDRRQPPLADAGALDLRQRTEQRLGVGMLRVVEELERRPPARPPGPRT